MKYLLIALLLIACSPVTQPIDINTLDDVIELMSEQSGNCYDIAVMAEWACNEIGMETVLVNMYNKHEGHSICLAQNKPGQWHMFQNNIPMYLVLNMPDDWELPLLELFGNRYIRIEIEKTITHDQGGVL